MKYGEFSPTPVATLPRRARRATSRGSLGACLCGCHRPTLSRFAPGHDSILRSHVLAVELGEVRHAPAPHTLAVEIEVTLRRLAGLTRSTHDQLLITPAIVAKFAPGQVA